MQSTAIDNFEEGLSWFTVRVNIVEQVIALLRRAGDRKTATELAAGLAVLEQRLELLRRLALLRNDQ